jgi:hypothetical protein
MFIMRITVASCVLILACWAPVQAKKIQGKETKNVSEPLEILKGIIEGIFSGDYDLYSRYFSESMRASQKREDFLHLQKNLQKKLGKMLSLDALGFYVQRGNFITLFKAKFSKDKDDVLIKLVLEEHGPDPRVAGLWFDSPVLEK